MSNAKPRKISKAEQRKAQQYQERRNRLINDGVSPDKVDDVIAKEDWDRLPTDKKVRRLEAIISKSFTGIAQDINSLAQNQFSLQRAMDINFAAVSRALEKAGVSNETQKEIIQGIEKELQEKLEAQRKQQEESSKAEDLSESVEDDFEGGSEAPEEATVFGG